ncbi:hypothetical protein LC087_13125 [Bacillus carboniphilus]|uniref:Uncharacterized protein n=1 Tax=Bacillus carboniphilus TaxID=86663 RepID=A0ABY9JQV7_9BACI|nr:hypothetical protein [Bacillus carboniphilus]WLR41785.1 hypothetical protein LC087_13125 [Bacillus carboniphilus]
MDKFKELFTFLFSFLFLIVFLYTKDYFPVLNKVILYSFIVITVSIILRRVFIESKKSEPNKEMIIVNLLFISFTTGILLLLNH